MPFVKRTDEIERDWERRKKRKWWKPKGKPNEPEILLRQVSPNTFQLMEGFRYELEEADRKPGDAEHYDVPAHELGLRPDAKDRDNSTDLASVPPALWWFISSYGRQTRPALLHDHLIDRADVLDTSADRIFRTALRDSEVPFLRRWIMWTAVSLASMGRTGWGLAGLALYGFQLIAFFASLVYWAFAGYTWWPLEWLWSPLGGGRWWPLEGRLWSADNGVPFGGNLWLPPLVLGISGLVWGLKWLFGVLGVALIALPAFFVGVTYFVVYCLDWLATGPNWLYAKLKGLDIPIPRPRFGHPYRHQAGPF